MTEPTTTTKPQADEVVAVDVQPEAAGEAAVANNKVVEESKSAGEVEASEPAASAEVSEEAKPAAATQEEPTAEATEKSGEQAEASSVDDSSKPVAADEADKVAEEKAVENNGKVDEKAEEAAVPAEAVDSNGDNKHSSEVAGEQVPETTDETNGVCKRKVDNCVESVEDEKTPKKAKVVDDGDQAPVEETAA